MCYNNNMKKLLQPTKKNINYWKKSFIPQKDVWFFRKKPPFENCCIMSIKEYLDCYDKIEYINAYCHWMVKSHAEYVICEKEGWISSLSDKERMFVYEEQIICERGLIIENIEKFVGLDVFDTAICNGRLILSNSFFNKLSNRNQEAIVLQYAQEQDDWEMAEDFPRKSYWGKVANTFVNNEGCNCLATVLYAITGIEHYLKKWVTQDEFLDRIKEYVEIEVDKRDNGDIVLFYDCKNNIQHASFVINRSLCLNKNGQSKFNPISILKFKNIVEYWSELKYKVLSRR